MAQDKVYPKGLMAFAPHANAPQWVKGSIVITPEELVKWMEENPNHLRNSEKYGMQLKLQLTENNGKLSLSVDTYQK